MKPKRIFDPIHRFIELDAGEVALLDAPVVQRLRRLRQLGLAYLAFPSAEHSRFTHALGALAIGTRAFDALRVHSPEAFGSRARRRGAAAAAAREPAAARRRARPVQPRLRSACSACATKRAPRRSSRCPRSRDRSPRSTSIPAAVLGLITGAPDADTRCCASWSADRTSTPTAWTTCCATPTSPASRSAATTPSSCSRRCACSTIDGRRELGVDGRGVVALESFVLARYMMFATVYFHHTTRMFERVLHDVLSELWPDPRALDDIDEFLAWDDFRVLDAIRDARRRRRARAARAATRSTAWPRSSTPSATSARSKPASARCASASATRSGATRRSSCCTGCRSAPRARRRPSGSRRWAASSTRATPPT